MYTGTNMSNLLNMPYRFPDEEYDAALVLCLLRYTDRVRHQKNESSRHTLIVQFESVTHLTLQIATLCSNPETSITELKNEAALLLGIDSRLRPFLVMQIAGIARDLHDSTTLSSLHLQGVTVMRMSVVHDR